MATEASASDHTSATYEQVEKNEKEKGIGEKSVSLSSENEEKGDECEDEAEGKDRKVEVEEEKIEEDTEVDTALVEEGMIDASSTLEASVADDLKAEKQMIPESPPISAIETLSQPPPTEEELPETKENNLKIQDKKLDADAALVEEENIDDSLSSEASVADNLKVEQQLILESPPISVNETPLEQPLTEEEPANSREDNLKTEEDLKPDAALVEEEKIDDFSSSSAADNLSVEKHLISESHPISVIETPPNPPPTKEDNLETKEDNEPHIAPVEEEDIDDSLSLEASIADNLKAEKQLSSESPSSPISVIETPLEPPPTEEESTKTREYTSNTKQDTKIDAAPVTEDISSLEASVADNLKAEKQLIPESPQIESPPTVDELVETREYKQPHTPDIPAIVNPQIESEAEALKETDNSEVQEKSLEPEKKSQQEGEEEQPNIEATPKSFVKTIEKSSGAILETTREPESDAESAVGTRVDENPSESGKLSSQKGEEEQLKTVIPETSAETTEKPGDTVEDHPPKHSHAVSTDGEKKPMEHSEMAEEVKEKSNDVESKQQLVGEFGNSEGTSDDIKEPIPSKEEEETSGIAEKFVEEVDKKERSCTDVIEVVSKEVEGILENPERFSVNQEANKTDQSVEEKVAENNVVEGLSREAETATTEEEQAKLESAKDDQPADDDKEEEEKAEAETKVDEIAPAASEPVRETLASKLEKKEEEDIITGADKLEKETVEEQVKTGVQIPQPLTKESDATKTSRETPAKPHQKHSNNILWKVKQSLLKAKKAITGKSPTTKTLSSEAKVDIQVK